MIWVSFHPAPPPVCFSCDLPRKGPLLPCNEVGVNCEYFGKRRMIWGCFRCAAVREMGLAGRICPGVLITRPACRLTEIFLVTGNFFSHGWKKIPEILKKNLKIF